MKKIIKKAQSVIMVFFALLLLWMVSSFMEVNAKNLTENPTYNDYNLFVLIAEK